MRYLVCLTLSVGLFLSATSFAADLLIVQSMRDASFTDVLEGFNSTCSGVSKRVVLSDYSDLDLVRLIREEQPSVIVALGEAAYRSVQKIRRIPIISLMSLGLSMGGPMAGNVTGVAMMAAPERYLSLFRQLRAKKVGVLYNPSRSGGYLQRARRVLERNGIDLVALEIRNPRDTTRLLATLKGRVDALWLLPDSTAVTPATTEAYFFFSMDEWKPVVAFSGVYLPLGAVAALEVDRVEMGRQGGVLANRLLQGTSPSELPFQDPSGVSLKKNDRLAGKLAFKNAGRD